MKIVQVRIRGQFRLGQLRDLRLQTFLRGGPVGAGHVHQRRIEGNRGRGAAGEVATQCAADQKRLPRGQNRSGHQSILAVVNHDIRPRAPLFNQSDVVADDVAHFSIIWQALKRAAAHYRIIAVGATQFTLCQALDVVDIFLPPDHEAVLKVGVIEGRIGSGAAGDVPLVRVRSGYDHMPAH